MTIDQAGLMIVTDRLRAGNGTQALPGWSFTLDTDSGVWLISGDRYAFVVGTAALLDVDYNGGTPTLGVGFDGTSTVAAVSRDTSRDVGIFWPTATALAITAVGEIARFAPDYVTFTSDETTGVGLTVDFVSNSATPADEDVLVTLNFIGQGPATYASIIVSIIDESSEEGQMLVECDDIQLVGGSSIGITAPVVTAATGAFTGWTVDNSGGAPRIGFLGASPVPRQTAATPTAAELKAGLVALGLFNA
jgi:hypothetical protein